MAFYPYISWLLASMENTSLPGARRKWYLLDFQQRHPVSTPFGVSIWNWRRPLIIDCLNQILCLLVFIYPPTIDDHVPCRRSIVIGAIWTATKISSSVGLVCLVATILRLKGLRFGRPLPGCPLGKTRPPPDDVSVGRATGYPLISLNPYKCGRAVDYMDMDLSVYSNWDGYGRRYRNWLPFRLTTGLSVCTT